MELILNKKDRLIVTLPNGSKYEGNLENFCESTEVLTLCNLIQYPDNLKLDGIISIQLDDVIDLKVKTDYEPPKTEQSGNESPTLNRKIPKADYFKLLNKQRGFRLINETGSDLHSAMIDVRNSKIMGICAREIIPGRQRKLSAIAVSTENSVYVFDLIKLRNKVFEKGLQNALESDSVVKVVYDCRFLSDCLYHKHGILLTNVRDVEAEDVVMTYREEGAIRRITRRYSALIQFYLGLPGTSVDEENLTGNWKRISRNPKLQTFLANYVSYLVPIHKSIENLYLQKLADASKMYTEVIRNSSDMNYILRDEKFVMVREMRDVLMPPITLSKKFSEVEL